jgi:hypothetical protein
VGLVSRTQLVVGVREDLMRSHHVQRLETGYQGDDDVMHLLRVNVRM